MNKLKVFSILILICFVAMMYGCKSSTETTPTAPYHIVSRSDMQPYGKSWEDWQSAWWGWVFSIDSSHHPLRETAPLDTMQTGKVWFLGGAFYQLAGGKTVAVRQGKIPYGTALYFPILNGEDDLATDTSVHSAADLIKQQNPMGWITGQPMSADIDGDSVANIPQYLSKQTQTFQCYLAPNNLDAAPAGTTTMLSDGYYLMVDGLSKGNHVIHFRSGTVSPPLYFDITYKLTVQ